MSKMGSHDAFGIFKTQIMAKRGAMSQIANLTPNY
jgi:hypothetical protein